MDCRIWWCDFCFGLPIILWDWGRYLLGSRRGTDVDKLLNVDHLTDWCCVQIQDRSSQHSRIQFGVKWGAHQGGKCARCADRTCDYNLGLRCSDYLESAIQWWLSNHRLRRGRFVIWWRNLPWSHCLLSKQWCHSFIKLGVFDCNWCVKDIAIWFALGCKHLCLSQSCQFSWYISVFRSWQWCCNSDSTWQTNKSLKQWVHNGNEPDWTYLGGWSKRRRYTCGRLPYTLQNRVR